MTLTHLSASSPAGAEQATAATETDTLGSTRYFEVCHSYWREQPNPLNGWNALDGGECYVFAATDAFAALAAWANCELPVSQWSGRDLADTGFGYDEGDLIIGEVTEHGFIAIDEDAREKVEVDVYELDRADAARRGFVADGDCSSDPTSYVFIVGDEHVVDEVTAATATDALRSYLGINDDDWAHIAEGWETPWYEVVTNYDSSSHAEVNGGDLCWITDISDGDDFARIVARVGLPDREGFTGQPLVVTATRCDA